MEIPNKKKFDHKNWLPIVNHKKKMNWQNILAYMSIETHKQTQNPTSLDGRFVDLNSKFYESIISLLGTIEQ
jgi:hypothetical protein